MKEPSIRVADVDAALDRLHLAIDHLEALLSSAAQRAELDALRRSALRLGEAASERPVPELRPALIGLRHFEPARFKRLLELAGPENGAELLACLSEDLISTRDRAAAAFGTLDWPELRGASHVLISLAGSVGAVSLQSLAERMNLASNSMDRTILVSLIPETLAELASLIDIVAATRPAAGDAA